MTKLGQDLIKAAKEGVAIARGEQDSATYRIHVPDEIDVRAIRESFDLTQSDFAAKFAVPVTTLRDWEQHRRKPSGMARLFLLMLAREPTAVCRVLKVLRLRTGGRRGKFHPATYRVSSPEVGRHVPAGVLMRDGRVRAHQKSLGLKTKRRKKS